MVAVQHQRCGASGSVLGSPVCTWALSMAPPWPCCLPIIPSTRPGRHVCLTQMDRLLPWGARVDLVAPHYYAAESRRGRPRVDLELMLRLYCLPPWYDLSDLATEEEVTDSLSMRHFAGLGLEDRVLDETTRCQSGTGGSSMHWAPASSSSCRCTGRSRDSTCGRAQWWTPP